VNRFQPGDVFSQSTIAESLKHEIFWSLPNDYRTSVSSLNKGVSVTQQDAGSKLARSYAQLAAKLRTTQAGSANGATDPQQRSGIRGLFGKSGRIGHVA
jgi:pilus assembly protein CpaE